MKKIKLIDGINSTKIRDMIRNDENWEKLVPNEIVEFMNEIKGVDRIKST